MTVSMNMLQRAASVPVFLVVAAVLVFSGSAVGEEKIVAMVNGKVISQQQFDREVKIFQQRSAQSGRAVSEDSLAKAKKDILENMIAAEVLYQESQREGIKVSDEAVDKQVLQIKGRFKDEVAFEDALKNMEISEKSMRQQIQRGLAINQLLDDNVRSKVKVSESDVAQFYKDNPALFKQPEQVRARHILIKVDAGATEQQKKQARDKIAMVQKKIKAGEDFAQLAQTYSEGPSAKRGGDLNYFSRGQMVKPFEKVAFSMKVGEVSGLVETQFGYHIIKAVDKKEARTVPFEEVKERLTEYLEGEKEKTEVKRYVDGLKGSAKIERKI